MKPKSAPCLSRQARQLVQHVTTLIQNYEASLGAVPVWIEEVGLNQALSLIGSCLRIGLRLPPEETLQAEMSERAQAQPGSRLRGSSKG